MSAAPDIQDFIEWLARSKSGIIRIADAELKLKELELDPHSADIFDAITSAGYYTVAGSSDLIIRGEK